MKNRIIEIVELGQFQSLIQRENNPITELIKTDSLIEELNEQLRKHNAVGQSELLKAFVDRWNDENEIADSPVIHDGFINEFLKSL